MALYLVQHGKSLSKEQDPEKGLAPMDDVAIFAKTIDCDQNIMLIGHLPFMERLAAYLVAGRPEPPVFKFQNSGIVCLDMAPDTGAWFLKWTLMPHIG